MHLHALVHGGPRLAALLVVLVASASGLAASIDAVDPGRPAEPARSLVRAGRAAHLARPAFSPEGWGGADVARIAPPVLELALRAARCATASGTVTAPATLTIIDYSRPSTEPRLWVLDFESRQVVYEELVAHGQGSGGNLARRFSNVPDSHQTSLGLFRTDSTYVGRNGYSLRLDGLDRGFNDRARERAIVMHGAPYVDRATARIQGRLGRSHGCPAVRDEVARELIDRIKGGDLVFAYYPDPEWLERSRFLTACAD